MPLLEYRCRDCGALFERLVPRAEGAETAACPACGSAAGQRVLSVVAPVRGAAAGCCGGGCGCGR